VHCNPARDRLVLENLRLRQRLCAAEEDKARAIAAIIRLRCIQASAAAKRALQPSPSATAGTIEGDFDSYHRTVHNFIVLLWLIVQQE
jgi:hypothetical protein